ncbi:hypothetical protein DM02DRAFT_650513 [Periconia macrospinosa]|uniref:RRM domain-containing protein n=1 Tax=Periconia macrospinosa TaxID=97972 RepID=A0A2V1E5Y0_9PLEO|nr:hypothetical protein DM02DRAFT_650513 [Periconia macrospinosa]
MAIPRLSPKDTITKRSPQFVSASLATKEHLRRIVIWLTPNEWFLTFVFEEYTGNLAADSNSEGDVYVKFDSVTGGEKALQGLNGRNYNHRVIRASYVHNAILLATAIRRKRKVGDIDVSVDIDSLANNDKLDKEALRKQYEAQRMVEFNLFKAVVRD